MTLRRLLLVVPAALVLGALGAGLFRSRPEASLGRPAPDFTLPDLREPARQVRLASLRGHLVVLNFWASWCEPCKFEAPQLASVAGAHPSVHFVGVDILDGREEALAFLRGQGIAYTAVRDLSGRVAKLYEVTGVPETVFVDASGRAVGKYVGAFKPGELETIVQELETVGPKDVLTITGRGETRPVP